MGCLILRCERPVDARGWCNTHYRRWLRHGSPDVVLDRTGERNGNYAGDNVGYQGVHQRLVKLHGPAHDYTCACGEQAQDWAFDMPTGFSYDLRRYTPLCRVCHWAQDRTS